MASRFPRVRLVSGPDPAAVVLMDFNEVTSPTSAIEVLADGFSFGTPALQGDPDSIFPAYGSRQISFAVEIKGNKSYAMARQSAAYRWLVRDKCWLMVQLSADVKPVWFKLYRPEVADLSLDNVFVRADGSAYTRPDRWKLSLTLPAEPYAYGAQETIGPVTITNNPVTGANKCYYQLPSILGDAPTPLTVDVVPSITWDDFRPLIATAAVDPAAGYPGPIVWQASAFAGGADTLATTPAVLYFGDGYRAVTFGTPTAAVRLSGPVPVTPPAGRYTVFARVGRNDFDSTFRMRLGQNYGLNQTSWGDYADFNRAASPSGEHLAYVPLGDFTWPLGADIKAPSLGTSSTPSISFEMSRTSGGGVARINGFVLVPVELAASVEARQLLSLFYGFGISNNRSGVWDGERKAFRAYDFGTSLAQGITPQLRGEFLTVVPGMTNVLHLLQQTYAGTPFFTGTANADSVSATASVRLTYYPKWLFIGDGT